MSTPPLIVHLIHHFDVGGLENGMVNLINHIPPDRFRHAIVCMQGFSSYHKRITNPAVKLYALEKKPGKDPAVFYRMARVFRELRPDIVHSRNLSALEGQFVAAICGVAARIHGEHGRDMFDLYGKNWKYNLLRKLARSVVHRYIALSCDLQQWLVDTVGVPRERIRQIYNGVDTERFQPRTSRTIELFPPGFMQGDEIIIGSVGRMAEVKNFPALVQAFLNLISARPDLRRRIRLIIVGEGMSRSICQELINNAGANDIVWLPGERSDIPQLMRAFDLFVLPSLGEGISNTILEAMASGLPVLATDVGGNPELVKEGVTGRLMQPDDPGMLAQIVLDYIENPDRLQQHGQAARKRVEASFSMDSMVRGYINVYDEMLSRPR